MKEQLTAIGLMSGTSMDGIDAALVVTDGEAHVEPGASGSRAYEPAFRDQLGDALRVAAADPIAARSELADIERRLTDLHGEVVEQLIADAGLRAEEIDVVGFHGQTVLHRPSERLTIQLGDGGRLADRLGISVINDFRAADIAAGGEGAPFAPAYHRALALASGVEPQAIINIGGVANVTWIGAGADPVAFDTGPGNALLDDLVDRRTGQRFDEGGRIAASGRIDQGALAALLDDAYFDRLPPKSLDRNAFSGAAVEALELADAAATLVAFSARTIANCARFLPSPPRRWVVTGGGRHNAAIMAGLGELLDAPVMAAEEAGWRGDEVEAEAFAYLAVRALKGLALSWPTTTGVPRPLTGGVVHRR